MKKHWYNNGIKQTKYFEGEQPEGYVLGILPSIKQRISETQQKFKWYHNDIDEVLTDSCPKGYVPGRLYHPSEETKKAHSQRMKGSTAWNKGLDKSDERVLRNSLGKTNTTMIQLNGRFKLVHKEELQSYLDAGWKLGNPSKGSKVHNPESIRKGWETKKHNKTCNTSKPEELFYKYLLTQYKEEDILRQYTEKRYPYHCDFYIKPLDLFIEINLFWTHGPKAFDSSDKDCIKLLEEWKERAKTSTFFEQAVECWTIRDVQKLQTAKDNNLNYIVYYDVNELYNIITNERNLFNE